jgi:hypothetical protein
MCFKNRANNSLRPIIISVRAPYTYTETKVSHSQVEASLLTKGSEVLTAFSYKESPLIVVEKVFRLIVTIVCFLVKSL